MVRQAHHERGLEDFEKAWLAGVAARVRLISLLATATL